MAEGDGYELPAGARARVEIDRQLEAAGWVIQDLTSANVTAAPGVAIREVTLEKGHGRATTCARRSGERTLPDDADKQD